MSRLLCLAALSLAVASAAEAQNITAGKGIITVQNAKFVDNACREFQFAGGNVYATCPALQTYTLDMVLCASPPCLVADGS